ncbi:ABC transporter permease [Geoglobus acetivorans]|uniref:ABC transporter permease n=1 Tax=Geoglobus acetivorans TaxID=565033 RepID=A0ABZ3H300_GEOAI|nr:ABC transporter permease [Geoglobus acetivorans]
MSSSSLRSSVAELIAFAYRNYAVTKNEFYALFEMLFWPVVSLFTIGLLGEFLTLKSEEISFILIGVIALSVIQIVQIDVTYVMLYDMWSMSLEYSVVSSAPFSKMVLGAWLFGVLRGFVAYVLLVISSTGLFGLEYTLPLLSSALFIFGIFLGALIIGLVNCIFILVFGRRAEIFAWTLAAIVMIFCGIYYPVEILPEPFRTAGYLIPITHFLEYFRSFYGYQPAFGNPLFIGFAESLVYLVLLFYTAEISLKRARKTGLVLKLSG